MESPINNEEVQNVVANSEQAGADANAQNETPAQPPASPKGIESLIGPQYTYQLLLGDEECDKKLDEIIGAAISEGKDLQDIVNSAAVVSYENCRPMPRNRRWITDRILQALGPKQASPLKSGTASAATATSAKEKSKKVYGLAKFPKDLRNIDRKTCHDSDSIFSYLVLPESDDQEGLFPKGELSLIAGASGSWKTTVILFFISLWKNEERFFGRRTCCGNGKYLIVSFDRSENGFARTAVRMGLDPNDFNLVHLGKDEFGDDDPIDIVNNIVTQKDFQDIQLLIVEGIDLKAGDVETKKKTSSIGDSHLVAKIMTGLREAAQRQRFALLASIGSPKQKGKDKYTSKRDQIIGSQAWGRTAETIVHLSQEDENDPNSRRLLSILPRNGKDESIPIVLDEHRRPMRAEPKKPLKDQIIDWAEGKELKPGQEFTLQAIELALKAKKSSVQTAVNSLIDIGLVTKKGYGEYVWNANETKDDQASSPNASGESEGELT